MLKTAVAISVAFSGEVHLMENVRDEFADRLERVNRGDRPPETLAEKYKDVIERQNALWADYDAAHPMGQKAPESVS